MGNTVQSQSFRRGLTGGGGASRRTYALKRHLPHLPERSHAPFDFDHGPDVHGAQIDIKTRGRDALARSIGPVRDR